MGSKVLEAHAANASNERHEKRAIVRDTLNELVEIAKALVDADDEHDLVDSLENVPRKTEAGIALAVEKARILLNRPRRD